MTDNTNFVYTILLESDQSVLPIMIIVIIYFILIV